MRKWIELVSSSCWEGGVGCYLDVAQLPYFLKLTVRMAYGRVLRGLVAGFQGGERKGLPEKSGSNISRNSIGSIAQLADGYW